MASWLKAAEDLFEVVDRRAKLVATERNDEHSDMQASVSDGPEGQARKSRTKEKLDSSPGTDTSRKTEGEKERKKKQIHRRNKQGPLLPSKDGEKVGTSQLNNDLDSRKDSVGPSDIKELPDVKESPIIDYQRDIDSNNGGDTVETSLPSPVNNIKTPASVAIGESMGASNKDTSALPASKEIEVSSSNQFGHDEPKVSLVQDEPSLLPSRDLLEMPGSINIIKPKESEKDNSLEPSMKLTTREEQKADSSPMKDQDQLEEAQGLLKNSVKTGQSKEARLARVCAGLSTRLQEYKSENAQLEELLGQEREKCTSYESQIRRLQQELGVYKTESTRAESNMVDALSAKNAEIESLVKTMDTLKKKTAASEEKIASMQEEMEAVRSNRELTETRVIQALREELASAERRAEEERAAHSATKMAAVEREVELEHRAVEAANALARVQRSSEESTSRALELEHKVAVLEVECASLQRDLQELESRNRRAQKKPAEEANQALQMQAWQEEIEKARQSQRDAENKVSTLEADLQKMRVEMSAMRRDAEHYSRQEHVELEKRYRELTDLLYHKQTQLESMTSQKAALEFQLEKELRRFNEVQVEAERSRFHRRSASTAWEEDSEIKSLEPLPLHHRHMSEATKQLQKAAKLLDTGAVRATRFLWRYPYARVVLLFYLVFVHLFLMYLLHHLQEQADNLASREVAASLGLTNSSLP